MYTHLALTWHGKVWFWWWGGGRQDIFIILFTAALQTLIPLVPFSAFLKSFVSYSEWSQTISGCVVWIITAQYSDLTSQWLSFWIDTQEVGVGTAASGQLHKAWTAGKQKYRISCRCNHLSAPCLAALWQLHLHLEQICTLLYWSLKIPARAEQSFSRQKKGGNESSLSYFCSALCKTPTETLNS